MKPWPHAQITRSISDHSVIHNINHATKRLNPSFENDPAVKKVCKKFFLRCKLNHRLLCALISYKKKTEVSYTLKKKYTRISYNYLLIYSFF